MVEPMVRIRGLYKIFGPRGKGVFITSKVV